MDPLYGPKLYYSLLGLRGLLLGARARMAGKPIEAKVEVSGIRHPVVLRLRTTDVALCREILVNRIYDEDLQEEPAVIIDAGANIGLAAVFYANRFPNAKVLAIEPESSNFQLLVRNAAPYPNIKTVQAALSRENGEVAIFNAGAPNTEFRTWNDGSSTPGNGRESIIGLTMDKIMLDHGIEHIDLLKMDIEGSEKDVFESSRGWVDRVSLVAVELHDWIRSGCTETASIAMRGFATKWERGEITYFARNFHAPAPSKTSQRKPPLPLKIISVQ